MANLLGRIQKKKQMCSVGCVNMSHYVMTALICTNYFCALMNRLTVKNRGIIITTEVVLPCSFIIVDSVVLGLAVWRVRILLKDSPDV